MYISRRPSIDFIEQTRVPPLDPFLPPANTRLWQRMSSRKCLQRDQARFLKLALLKLCVKLLLFLLHLSVWWTSYPYAPYWRLIEAPRFTHYRILGGSTEHTWLERPLQVSKSLKLNEPWFSIVTIVPVILPRRTVIGTSLTSMGAKRINFHHKTLTTHQIPPPFSNPNSPHSSIISLKALSSK